ncbi:MAG: hypothetical protein J0H29_03355 [Sphingobacteriales bacterium]|nr:hypothetical protein [Sphingobacteriales bacterium]OJY87265.1 MAG: hypothetical protein BGP14_09150 [Sphingobacteriales bacterium 44-15]
MSILNKLATSQNRNDELPNIELAIDIANNKDKAAVKELVALVLSGKNRDIQNDSIKVLYEVGERNPSLISHYSNTFAGLLSSKNNRLQWGAMSALNAIASIEPDLIYYLLPELEAAVAKGSVITRDNYVYILIRLAGINNYRNKAIALLKEQLINCPANQLPMYAEKSLPIITSSEKDNFIQILQSRWSEFEKASKQVRVEKVIRKLQKTLI